MGGYSPKHLYFSKSYAIKKNRTENTYGKYKELTAFEVFIRVKIEQLKAKSESSPLQVL